MKKFLIISIAFCAFSLGPACVLTSKADSTAASFRSSNFSRHKYMKSKRAKRIKTKYRTSRAHPHSRQARYEAKRVPMGNTQEYMLWAPSKR